MGSAQDNILHSVITRRKRIVSFIQLNLIISVVILFSRILRINISILIKSSNQNLS